MAISAPPRKKKKTTPPPSTQTSPWRLFPTTPPSQVTPTLSLSLSLSLSLRLSLSLDFQVKPTLGSDASSFPSEQKKYKYPKPPPRKRTCSWIVSPTTLQWPQNHQKTSHPKEGEKKDFWGKWVQSRRKVGFFENSQAFDPLVGP